MNLGPITNYEPMWSAQSDADRLTEQQAEALVWQEQADRDERDLWTRLTRCVGFATALLHYIVTTPERLFVITLFLIVATCLDLGYILVMAADRSDRPRSTNRKIVDDLVETLRAENSKNKRRLAVYADSIANIRQESEALRKHNQDVSAALSSVDPYFYRDASGRLQLREDLRLTEGDYRSAAPRFTYTEARDYTPAPPDAPRDYTPKTVK